MATKRIEIAVLVFPNGECKVHETAQLGWLSSVTLDGAVAYRVEVDVPIPEPKPSLAARLIERIKPA